MVNLGMGRIDAMLKILDVEGAVRRDGTRWRRSRAPSWTYDAERYAQVTALRRPEQRAMAAFGADGRCLMRVLQEELDDPDAEDCGRCSVCTAPRFARATGSGAGRAGGAPPALEAGGARGQEDGAGCRRRDAQDPGGCPHRARLGARALRRRRLVAGDRARPGAGAFDARSSTRSRTSCEAPAAARPGSPPSRRRASATRSTGSPSASRPSSASRTSTRPAHRGSPAPAGDGQRRSAGRQRPRRVHGDRHAAARAPASCSTTAATRAGRWRWWAVSCAGPARSA